MTVLGVLFIGALLLSVAMGWLLAALVVGVCLVLLVGGLIVRYVRRPYGG